MVYPLKEKKRTFDGAIHIRSAGKLGWHVHVATWINRANMRQMNANGGYLAIPLHVSTWLQAMTTATTVSLWKHLWPPAALTTPHAARAFDNDIDTMDSPNWTFFPQSCNPRLHFCRWAPIRRTFSPTSGIFGISFMSKKKEALIVQYASDNFAETCLSEPYKQH